MNWSPQQDSARRVVARWMRDPSAQQVLYLAGFAGTGKTTLAKDLVDGSSKKWLFAAYTGKAAHVLSTKGCAGARTIHSLIYRFAGDVSKDELHALERELGSPATPGPRRLAIARELLALQRDHGPRFALWETGPLSLDDVSGVVVDEVSMVDRQLGQHLESFGKKILVLGDPAQLPPVRGCGFFTSRDPDVMLTEVHRQAADRGVYRLAMHVRDGRSLSSFQSTPDAEIVSYATTTKDQRSALALAADQVLVGLNKTRRDLNARLRQLRQRDRALPYCGDRLVCLRNEKSTGLFNGSQWIVESVTATVASQNYATITVRSEDDGRRVSSEAWLHHFLGRSADLDDNRKRDRSEYDWGYALTVHKAQGSEWDRVLIVDESRRLGGTDPSRWLYTAVTRAQNHVAVFT